MLNYNELELLQNIESKYYMQPTIEKIKMDVASNKHSLEEVFNYLYDYLINSKDVVKILYKIELKKVR